MAPRKLSDSDKSALIDLYKQPGQTTTTLAEKFGVSNSTVSRILKSAIPQEEYRELIAAKRTAGSDKAEPAKKASKTQAPKKKAPAQKAEAEKPAEVAPEAKAPVRRRRRRNAQPSDEEQLPLLAEPEETIQEETPSPAKPKPAAPVLVSADEDDDDDDEDDLLSLDEALSEDFGDDDDLDEDDDDEDVDEVETPKPKLQTKTAMEIMPLKAAVLPKPSYLVVDMRSELITRPLAEFADLGQIPSVEEKEKTLPVFDNHRVARRFSRNKQRVIKVPDGNLIVRTSPYLQAKGITRLLVDGQVFDVAGVE